MGSARSLFWPVLTEWEEAPTLGIFRLPGWTESREMESEHPINQCDSGRIAVVNRVKRLPGTPIAPMRGPGCGPWPRPKANQSKTI